MTDPYDEEVIHDMEVFLVLEDLEERGLIKRLMIDGEEYYALTEEGELEAIRTAMDMGYDSVEEMGQDLFGIDDELD